MRKGNLALLDCDEHRRQMYEEIHSNLLAVAKEYNFIVDLATSDVVMYLENAWEESMCIG